MLTTAQMDAHLGKMIADNPTSITWSSASYVCEAADYERALEHELDGDLPMFDIAFYIRASLFTSGRPVTGQAVTWAGKDYRIIRDALSSDGIEVTLYCKALRG